MTWSTPTQRTPAPAPASPLFAMWMWLGGALVLVGTAVTLFLAGVLSAPSSDDVCGVDDSTLGECYLAAHQDHVYIRELTTMSVALAAAAFFCLCVAFVVWLARRP